VCFAVWRGRRRGVGELPERRHAGRGASDGGREGEGAGHAGPGGLEAARPTGRIAGFVETMSPFPQGTKVRLRISRAGAHVTALSKVANSRPNAGMGIAFITIEPSSFPVLDGWLASLKK
jgi:hypothetical protein